MNSLLHHFVRNKNNNNNNTDDNNNNNNNNGSKGMSISSCSNESEDDTTPPLLPCETSSFCGNNEDYQQHQREQEEQELSSSSSISVTTTNDPLHFTTMSTSTPSTSSTTTRRRRRTSTGKSTGTTENVVDEHEQHRMIFYKNKHWNVLFSTCTAVSTYSSSMSIRSRYKQHRRGKRDKHYNLDTNTNGKENTGWIIDAAPIPAEHPLKITWDVLTILLSLTVGVYTTHAAIRDRCFLHNYNLHFNIGSGSHDLEEHCSSTAQNRFDLDNVMHARWIPTVEVFGHKFNAFAVFIEVWFFVDIILNFFTQHKVGDTGVVLTKGREVKLRYLKTWFVVDALSLVPWERVLIQPVIDLQNRRNWFQKTFFRSRAVVRVTPKVMRNLRKTNILMFGRVARQTGWGQAGLVKKMIRYMPRYLMFYRNMKGALAVRTLRQVHWFRKIFKLWWAIPMEEELSDSVSLQNHDRKMFLYSYTSSIHDSGALDESIEVVLVEVCDKNAVEISLSDKTTVDAFYVNPFGTKDLSNEKIPPLSPIHSPSLKPQHRLGSRVFTQKDDGQFVPASPIILRAKRLADFS